MPLLTTITEIKSQIAIWKRNNFTIAFVPTMGGLHKGHLSLVKKAAEVADKVIVSIFVNPKQFGENEDFDSYPRDIEEDKKKLADYKVDVIFIPEINIMYHKEYSITIDVGDITKILCGKSRPIFFNGIALVVSKLFNIVRPDIAIFGEKDYQQLQVIKKLVTELNFNIKIISSPIIREEDGLAMSTRNEYLTKQQREIAANFYKILSETANNSKAIIKQNKDISSIKKDAINKLAEYFEVDYLEILDAKTLAKINKNSNNYIVISAVMIGKTRLIDNIQFNI